MSCKSFRFRIQYFESVGQLRDELFDLDGLSTVLTFVASVFQVVDAKGDEAAAGPEPEAADAPRHQPRAQTALVLHLRHALNLHLLCL